MSLPRGVSAAPWLGCAALALACGPAPRANPTQTEASAVVFGADDRVELAALEDASLRDFGTQSVVALVEDATVAALGTSPEDGALHVFEAPSWAERRGLCDDVRFAEQPSAATCSGILVGEDLVLTAGHCARGLDCSALSVVFGFHYDDAGVPHQLGADDVYRCSQVVTFEIPTIETHLDYGFLRLDRPVAAPRRPLRLPQNAEAVSRSAALTAFGFGGGIPLKAQTVPIFDERAASLDYFITALDAFEGDSGAPVLSAGGTVVGIVTGGQGDYQRTAAGCTDIATDVESEAAEHVTYAFQARAALCSGATPDSALCEAPPAHGAAAACGVARSEGDGRAGALALIAGALVLRLTSQGGAAVRVRGGRHVAFCHGAGRK
jgi:hypothetical protein